LHPSSEENLITKWYEILSKNIEVFAAAHSKVCLILACTHFVKFVKLRILKAYPNLRSRARVVETKGLKIKLLKSTFKLKIGLHTQVVFVYLQPFSAQFTLEMCSAA